MKAKHLKKWRQNISKLSIKVLKDNQKEKDKIFM